MRTVPEHLRAVWARTRAERATQPLRRACCCLDTACTPPKASVTQGPAQAEQQTQPSRKRQVQVSVKWHGERIPKP